MINFPKLSSKAVLSPMAGVTDVAFRTLAKQFGAGLTYTEFVSSTALIRGSKKSQSMLVTDPIEKPVAVQIFGNNENDILKTAKIVEKKFDILDMNCGCPAWKVIKSGAGSEMLKQPKKIQALVEKVVKAVKIPVTVKIRTGINDKSINAIKIAKIIEKAGASALAIHGRTQQQGYSGHADWKIIKQIKESINIPVIGNGDIFTPEQFKEKLEYSGVDYIMVARGALGKPYIFKQINDYLKKGKYQEINKTQAFEKFTKLAIKYKINFTAIRQHAFAFIKGSENSTKLRNEINTKETVKEILDVFKNNNI